MQGLFKQKRAFLGRFLWEGPYTSQIHGLQYVKWLVCLDYANDLQCANDLSLLYTYTNTTHTHDTHTHAQTHRHTHITHIPLRTHAHVTHTPIHTHTHMTHSPIHTQTHKCNTQIHTRYTPSLCTRGCTPFMMLVLKQRLWPAAQPFHLLTPEPTPRLVQTGALSISELHHQACCLLLCPSIHSACCSALQLDLVRGRRAITDSWLRAQASNATRQLRASLPTELLRVLELRDVSEQLVRPGWCGCCVGGCGMRKWAPRRLQLLLQRGCVCIAFKWCDWVKGGGNLQLACAVLLLRCLWYWDDKQWAAGLLPTA